MEQVLPEVHELLGSAIWRHKCRWVCRGWLENNTDDLKSIGWLGVSIEWLGDTIGWLGDSIGWLGVSIGWLGNSMGWNVWGWGLTF